MNSSKFRVPDGAVLVSKLNPRIPRVWLADRPSDSAIASTEFLACKPREPYTRNFCFELFASSDFRDRYAGLSGGTSTSHQRVKPDDFARLQVILPTAGLVARFTELAAPMHTLIDRIRRTTSVLRRTRDLLLPRLISGELDVSELDIDIGELSA